MKKRNLARVTTVAVALGFAAIALANLVNQNATLSANTALSLDTGATSASGGDLVWNGSSITFAGSAKGASLSGSPYNLSGSSGYTEAQSIVSAFPASELSSLVSLSTSLPASALTVNSVFAVLTNGGNAAVALVTGNSGGTLTIEFSTYGSTSGGSGGGGTSAPTVTNIINNSSLIPNGFPNSGVAPSTLFVIHGSNMASATTVTSLQNPASGLPSTLNGATVTISAGGKTWNPGLYYAEATQIAGVLPAAVPVGSASLTVNYNGGTSTALTFQVVSSAYGVDTYDGNLAVLQDALSASLIGYTSSAKPSQIVLVWGTGLGADSADSDTTQTSSPHTINTPVQIYVGGVQVPASNIAYVGASVYPGVHIIQFTMPSGVPNGCFVPLAIITGSGTVSNIATIPFMDAGGVCNDSYYGVSGGSLTTISGSENVNEGFVGVEQITTPAITGGGTTTQDLAIASFENVMGTFSLTGSSSGEVSLGGCILTETTTSSGSGTVNITETGLNAGTVTVTPPGGSPITLQTFAQEAGIYEAQLTANAIPSSGGTFTFNWTGASGANTVSAGSAAVNFISPLSWTNQSASATVTRSSGQTYTWSGGTPGSYVIVTGSSASTTTGASGSYTCIAPASAGSIAVPSYITDSLPAGTGSSSIENASAFSSFTASPLNVGTAFGAVLVSVNTTWQ